MNILRYIILPSSSHRHRSFCSLTLLPEACGPSPGGNPIYKRPDLGRPSGPRVALLDVAVAGLAFWPVPSQGPRVVATRRDQKPDPEDLEASPCGGNLKPSRLRSPQQTHFAGGRPGARAVRRMVGPAWAPPQGRPPDFGQKTERKLDPAACLSIYIDRVQRLPLECRRGPRGILATHHEPDCVSTAPGPAS